MTVLPVVVAWLACGTGTVLLAKRIRSESGMQAPFPRADVPIALALGPFGLCPLLFAYAYDSLMFFRKRGRDGG